MTLTENMGFMTFYILVGQFHALADIAHSPYTKCTN